MYATCTLLHVREMGCAGLTYPFRDLLHGPRSQSMKERPGTHCSNMCKNLRIMASKRIRKRVQPVNMAMSSMEAEP